MLTAALGEEKAGGLIDRILLGGSTSGLDSLKWMEPRAVADVIRYEHPQIQAIVVAYLDPDQAGEVLSHFDTRFAWTSSCACPRSTPCSRPRSRN